MGLFTLLKLDEGSVIDWEMSPEYTFGTFESWGGKERVRSEKERIYYFFIDAWEETPRLCLMERGIKHARVVAEIRAPRDMVEGCVAEQGKVALYERTHGINNVLRRWLKEKVVDGDDPSLVIPLEEEKEEQGLGPSGLPPAGTVFPGLEPILLPGEREELDEDGVRQTIIRYDFVDQARNPNGTFTPVLVDNGDGLTVTDCRTGLMWQRGGQDIMSFRSMSRELARVNREGFAGFNDWRLPSLAEAMSLMVREKTNGQYLHSCFSTQQPFIFVNGVRRPGGYWFVDFKQGRAFWSSGTIPGGFGRFCRRAKGE